MRKQITWLVWGLIVCCSVPVQAKVSLTGQLTQGGLVLGQTANAAKVSLDGKAIAVADNGAFVFGFGRDASLNHQLIIIDKYNNKVTRNLKLSKRNYKIQRITGISKKIMQPSKTALVRIEKDVKQVVAARQTASKLLFFSKQFIAPSHGIITGVYGSQRVFNGVKKRPHFGLDYAGKVGDPVIAPAAGRVTLFVPDMFYSGGTMIIDHGFGISSTFLHLSHAYVKQGDEVKQGQLIAAVGRSGRATGPHLDWRVNWYNVRLDPALVLKANHLISQ